MRNLPPLLRRLRAFTLIELLTVMAIIAILAGLILSISGYVNKKGAAARATAEIQALSSACESYKSDNGIYPNQLLAVSGSVPATTGSSPSDQIDPRNNVTQTLANYNNSSLELYEALTGDLSTSGTMAPGTKSYLPNLKQDMLGRNDMTSPVSPTNQVTYLSDPFGNSYGYSTMNSTAVKNGVSPPLPGYNPTYDLWSTAGGTIPNTNTSTGNGTSTDPSLQWITNWR